MNTKKKAVKCEQNKTYRRGEVYSFALVPIYKDGSYGFAYHIPGNDVTTAINTAKAAHKKAVKKAKKK